MRDEVNIESWYVEFSQDIHHFLVYYNRTADVDDLLQEVFIKAFRHHSRFKGEASPKTWLISIARRVSIDQARKRKVKNILPFKHEIQAESSPNPEEQMLLDERNNTLYACINQLKQNYRDVVICKGIMELSSIETADVLNWSREKVDTTYFRAKKKLREMIETQGRDLIEEGRFRSPNE